LGFNLVVVRDPEPLDAAVVVPKPKPVGHDVREDGRVLHAVLVAEDQELLAVVDEQVDVFTKKTERRVGHHDVGLVKERHALRASEIAIPVSGLIVLASWRSRCSTSVRSIAPSLLRSGTSSMTTTYGSRGGFVFLRPAVSSSGNCFPLMGEPA